MRVCGFFINLLLVVFCLTPALADNSVVGPDDSARTRVAESYGKLPLSFIENRGHLDDRVLYYLKGSQGMIYFTREGIVYDLASGVATRSKGTAPSLIKHHAFSMKLLGANKMVRLYAQDKLPGTMSYFIGNDPAKWRTGIPLYRQVIYKDLYAGIDLKVYGTNNQMEYDFIVAPGVDPGVIRMVFEGIDSVYLDSNENLVIKAPPGDVIHLKPLMYQEVGANRCPVEGSFRVADNTASFTIQDYDTRLPLIIDPLTLSYSTYLGGSSPVYGNFLPAHDLGRDIAVDSAGNAYVTGETASTDFPLANPYQGTSGGGWDAFITKLSADGTTLVYSTYLGGSADDGCYSIAVDSAGNAYVTGYTESTDFPTENPFQGTNRGGDQYRDAFITKLSADGTTLVYSTYLGGSDDEEGFGIAVDSAGNAYVTGETASTDFPLANAYQGTYGGGWEDAFVTKLSADGSTLVYSTYLGGSDFEYNPSIAVDSAGNAYVAGSTESTDFPTENPFQGTYRGGVFSGDAFITKLSPDGTTLVYSTYLGGSNDEEGFGIAIDSAGNAYVTGRTWSTDFPTENAYQGVNGGYIDVFITKLSSDGTTLVYSTYLGGSKQEVGNGIAVDSAGNAYVTGSTESTDFPTEDPYQHAFGGAIWARVDAFVIRLKPSGNMLSYSSYLGGNDGDTGSGIAVDSAGNAYVVGMTISRDFPTKNPYQETLAGNSWDAFVAKLIHNANFFTILHRDGAVYDSASGWNIAMPPYYPGTGYAQAVQHKSGKTNYVILHKDGALWDSETGWLLTTPPYYPGTAYARDLEQRSRIAWNQTLSANNTNAYSNQDFETIYDAYDMFIADDFTAPEPWTIRTIYIPGFTWYPGSSLMNANSLHWQIYADAGGVPAGDPYGGGNLPVWSLSLPPGDPQVTLSAGFGGLLSDVTLSLSVPLNLPAGTYWLVFYPQLNADEWGQYGRHVSDTTNGYTAKVMNPGGGFGFPATWTDVTDPTSWGQDGLTQQDFAFRIEGEPSDVILHQDGALWDSVDDWTLSTPPYYPGTKYAVNLEYRSDGSYVILHKDGAVYDSASGWLTSAPPYYPGTGWAVDLKLKPNDTAYVILHRDGALWSPDAGWKLSTPPYYPGTGYARDLEFRPYGTNYYILHRDGAIYDSDYGWNIDIPPYYPGTAYAVDLEVR